MLTPEEPSAVRVLPGIGTPPRGLSIRVLGPLEVHADGQPVVVDTRKALAILAVAAVEARPMARDELAVMFWPEADDESARGALRRTLSTLRAALDDRWLQVDRNRIELLSDDVWVDARVADEHAAGGSADGLAAAAALHRGDFMAGFGLRDSPSFDDWLATRSEERRRSLADLLDRLDRTREAAGNLSGATVAAARRLELDALDEAGQRRMMELLALAGDRAGAIRQYRQCVAVLERELGVGPLEQTTALYEAIREGRYPPIGAPSSPERGQEPPARGIAVMQVGGQVRTHEPIHVDLPLVGRDAVLERLTLAWRESSAGGHLAVVEGEAGIGKTRVAAALGDAVTSEGGVVLAARSYPSESTIPFGPIGELVRAGLAWRGARERLLQIPVEALMQAARLVPSVRDLVALPSSEEALAEPAARLRLMDGLVTVLLGLVAGPKPGLLWLDDLAWADASTVEVISYLVNRLDALPLLILATWRREDLTEQLAAVVRAADRENRGRSELLDRLQRDAVAVLVRSVPERHLDVDAVVAESEGLPLYIAELIASTGEPTGSIPRGVRSVLVGRLAGVGGSAAQILAAAAVLGRSFDFDLVRQTSGRTPDETVDGVELLVKRGILREVTSAAPAPIGYDFAHGRLRDVTYEGISMARRRRLHARAADAVRSGHLAGVAAASRMALIGNHEREAGRFAAAAEAFALAGHEAAIIHAPVEALAHFEASLALGHPDPPAIRAAIGDARIRLGDYAGAIEVLEAAAGDVTDPLALASIELRLGTVHARRGDLAAADSHLVASAELLVADADLLVGAGGDSAIRASLLASVLADRALVAHRLGDEARAEELASKALATLGTEDGPADREAGVVAARVVAARVVAARARPHQILGLVALARGDLDRARSNLERALDESAGLDLPVTVASKHALAQVASRSGDLIGATELAEAALTEGRRLGDRHVEAALENTLADILHAAGRDDQSMIHLKLAVALFAEVGGRPGDLEPEIWKLVEW